jgi:hypothetical protein
MFALLAATIRIVIKKKAAHHANGERLEKNSLHMKCKSSSLTKLFYTFLCGLVKHTQGRFYFMGKRTNTAVWLPKYNRWQVKVQQDGVRRTFTSSKPGRTGQREANAKADAWLDQGIQDQRRELLPDGSPMEEPH